MPIETGNQGSRSLALCTRRIFLRFIYTSVKYWSKERKGNEEFLVHDIFNYRVKRLLKYSRSKEVIKKYIISLFFRYSL